MAQTAEEIAQSDKVSPRAWGILAVTYFASICAPLCQFKVPAAADWIFASFAQYGLAEQLGATFGLLMSALSIIGVILAFPAAWLAKGMGLKNTILLSLACLAVGSVMFGVSTSIPMLMVARALEGIGLGFIGVAAPSCVTIWFPERKRGLALGIWATWVPFGSILAFMMVPRVATMGGDAGLQLSMNVVAIICAVAFVLFLVFYKMPEGAMGDMALGVEGSFISSFKLLNNRRIWILGIIFFLFAFATMGVVNTYFETHLTTNLGYSSVDAGTFNSVLMLISLVAAPLTGLVSDKLPLGRKYIVGLVMFVICLASTPILFFGEGTGSHEGMIFIALIAVVILQGIGGGMCGGALRPMAPMLMANSAMGATMAMAMLQFFQNLGSAVGSPVFGYLYETVGWQMGANLILIPCYILAFVLCFFVLPRGKNAKFEDSHPREEWPEGF